MSYVILTYEQDYYKTYLAGLDYEDYSRRLDLLSNAVILAVM